MSKKIRVSASNIEKWVGTLALAGLVVSSPLRTACAAETGDEGTNEPASASSAVRLEEIVVTAEKRSERELDVPISITTLTGESLQQGGAVSYGDYLSSVPGVAYTQDGGFLDKIFIRGLADSISSQGASTTGIYLDEAVLTESTSAIGDMGTFDINRVEVLRGPQGTLYGDSSMGGTIRIVTNKPDLNQFSALVSSTVSGTEHGGVNDAIDAMLNVPIIPGTFGLRMATSYSHDDGFIDDIATGNNDINTTKNRKARLLAQYDPIDRLSILFSFNYADHQGNSGPFQDVGLGPHQVQRLFGEYADYESRLYGLTLNYDMDWATLTSATNYLDKTNHYSRDVTGLFLGALQGGVAAPLPSNTAVGLLYNFPNKLFTEEFRLVSNQQGPFHWLLGGYYSRFSPNDLQDAVTTSPLTQGLNILTVDSGLYQRQIAAFGELTYTLFGKLDLTAGIRQFNFRTEDNATANGLLEGGNTVVEDVSSDQTSHVAKYRVAYHLTGDNLLYAQAAQGFRVGGGLGGFDSEDATELKALGYATPPSEYRSDTLWNYELGSKNSFFEGRFSVSGDIYYIDWKNIQIAINLPDGNQFISNAARATSKGAELEAQVRPVAGLELNMSGAYTNATYGDTSAATETIAGASLPNVPRWTYSLSGTYTHAIANGYDGYLRADLRHIASRFNDLPGNTSGLVNQPSYTLLNMRIGAMHDGWEAALFVDNLTNKVAILNTSFLGALEYETINTPRTAGLNLKKRF